jgi:hypothetical protein
MVDEVSGAITNIDAESSCACFAPPEAATQAVPEATPETGCLLCGEPLLYQPRSTELTCAVCGVIEHARAHCENGHYVCDTCHIREPIEVTKRFCLASEETDAFRLFYRIADHPVIPMHGPEYHSIVPGVILSVFRNAGGPITDDQILEGIDRGALTPGGSCAFMGICGAATGVGIAFGIILESNPLKPSPRRDTQLIVTRALERIASLKAARCCRRESHLAFQTAAEEAVNILSAPIRAESWRACEQYELNKECIRGSCPFFRKS